VIFIVLSYWSKSRFVVQGAFFRRKSLFFYFIFFVFFVFGNEFFYGQWRSKWPTYSWLNLKKTTKKQNIVGRGKVLVRHDLTLAL